MWKLLYNIVGGDYMYLNLIDINTGEILAQSYNFDYLFTIAKHIMKSDTEILLAIL